MDEDPAEAPAPSEFEALAADAAAPPSPACACSACTASALYKERPIAKTSETAVTPSTQGRRLSCRLGLRSKNGSRMSTATAIVGMSTVASKFAIG